MDEITNGDQLEAWLKERPHEDAVLISARSALRVFPLLAPVIETNAEQHRATFIFPVCRTLAVASVASSWPKRAKEVREAADVAKGAAEAALTYFTTAVAPASVQSVASAHAAATYAATTDGSYATASIFAAARAVGTTGFSIPYANTRDVQAVFWRSVSDEVGALEGSSLYEHFIETPLWHSGTPGWIRDPWHFLREHLLAADEGWEVWTAWYQDRLDGKAANEELEVAKALIPDKFWKAGPATLNAEIARLIVEHELKQQSEPAEIGDEGDLPRQLTASELFAESDFEYQPESDRMVAVPFEDDASPVGDDPFRLRDRVDLLSTLSDLANDLFNDLKVDQPQVPPSLRRDINRYGRECALDVEFVRPRRLVSLAVALQRALQDEDIRFGLGNYLLAKLEDLMVQHNSLIGRYYVAVLDHASQLHDHELPKDFESEKFEGKLEQADQMVKSADWAALPALPAEYPELIDAQREALKEMCQSIELKPEAEVRARLRREVEECYLTLGSSMARLIVRTVEAAGSSKRVAGSAAILGISTAALSVAGGILRMLGLL